MGMEAMTSAEATAPRRHVSWAVTIILTLALLGVLGFAWKVFSFYRQIQSGTIDPGTYGQTRTNASVEAALAALVAHAKGSGSLATSDDPMLGSPNAKVTIVEFGDFGCPYTREESFVLRALATKFGSSIRYIYRDFPIEELHPGAERAAAAGTCADAQGKFWEFHDEIFASSDISEERVLAIADEIGLDVERFVDCVNAPMTQEEMDEDLVDGLAAEVSGTPTFFINGERVEGAVPFDLFVKIIEAFLVKS